MADWTAYQIYDPGLDVAREDAPRPVAEAPFCKLMAEKPDRIAMLKALTEQNDVSIDFTDEGLDRLERWISENIEEGDEPGALMPRWYSVVNDASLFIGEAIIHRKVKLYWEFSTSGGADSVHYQRPVIKGFTTAETQDSCMDPDLDIASYFHAMIEGDKPVFGEFRSIVAYAVVRA